MKSLICLPLLFVVLTAPRMLGQQQEHNGFWWAELSDTFKLGFITGYGEAMTLNYNQTGFDCLADKNGGTVPQKLPDDKVMTDCFEKNAKLEPLDFTKLRFGQMAEGVDEFYKDFRNKAVHVNRAMRYVRDELRGKPAKELEDELTRWRRDAAH
jgi:hypothetical protein